MSRGEGSPTPWSELHFCPSHLERDRGAQKEACCLLGRTKGWGKESWAFGLVLFAGKGAVCRLVDHNYFCLEKKK